MKIKIQVQMGWKRELHCNINDAQSHIFDGDTVRVLKNDMPIKETDETACVAWLMRLYQEKTKQ